jgi:hypothetical protein
MKPTTLVLTLLLLVGCSSARRDSDSPRYVHFVAMWLKEPGNQEHRQKIIDTSSSFVGKIPGLIAVYAGPVEPSTRPVVDSTYDVGLVMIFENLDALTKYPSYPIHQQALKEVIMPLVDHYKVYDFADRAKRKGRSGERPFKGLVDSPM